MISTTKITRRLSVFKCFVLFMARKYSSSALRALTSPASSTAVVEHPYQLLDFGRGKRCEKFGEVTVVRPCRMENHLRQDDRVLGWSQYDWKYVHEDEGRPGNWNRRKSDELLGQKSWQVRLENGLVFNLSPLEGGQVGIFPEQRPVWEYLQKTVPKLVAEDISLSDPQFRILNAFAYTGGSTMACLVHPKVQVTHLDASKPAISNAKTNVEDAGLEGSVRWMLDDCMSFLEREVRRLEKAPEKRYHGIIIDPPAFGRLAHGKKSWLLKNDLPPLLSLLPKLLVDDPWFVVLSCHDVNWPASRLEKELAFHLGSLKSKGELGQRDLVLKAGNGKELKLGSVVRWSRARNQNKHSQ